MSRHAITKAVTTFSAEVDLFYIHGLDRFASPFSIVIILSSKTSLVAILHVHQLWNLDELVFNFATTFVDNLSVRQLVLDTLQDSYLVSRSTAIVTSNHDRVVSVRTNHCDSLDILAQRQHVVSVLQHYDTLLSHLQSVCLVFRAVDYATRNLREWHHLSRVEHTQLDAFRDDTTE